MIIIIDYNMGNVASVKKALEYLGADVTISNDHKKITEATHLVFPGVGTFGDGMDNLKKLDLVDIITRRVLKDKVPFLGICLGMQLLCERGHEFGYHEGLSWINGEAVKLNLTYGIRLPHIGWNDITLQNNGGVLFKNLPDNNFYFVHSYHLKLKDKKMITSTCLYEENFAASIEKDNIFATQFHPEKSQTAGLQVLKNFLAYHNHA